MKILFYCLWIASSLSTAVSAAVLTITLKNENTKDIIIPGNFYEGNKNTCAVGAIEPINMGRSFKLNKKGKKDFDEILIKKGQTLTLMFNAPIVCFDVKGANWFADPLRVKVISDKASLHQTVKIKDAGMKGITAEIIKGKV